MSGSAIPLIDLEDSNDDDSISIIEQVELCNDKPSETPIRPFKIRDRLSSSVSTSSGPFITSTPAYKELKTVLSIGTSLLNLEGSRQSSIIFNEKVVDDDDVKIIGYKKVLDDLPTFLPGATTSHLSPASHFHSANAASEETPEASTSMSRLSATPEIHSVPVTPEEDQTASSPTKSRFSFSESPSRLLPKRICQKKFDLKECSVDIPRDERLICIPYLNRKCTATQEFQAQEKRRSDSIIDRPSGFLHKLSSNEKYCFKCGCEVHGERHKHVFEVHLKKKVIKCPIKDCEVSSCYETALVQNHLWEDHQRCNRGVIDRRGDYLNEINTLILACFQRKKSKKK